MCLKVAAERNVSYDHGMEGSIAEDCFFSMIAMKHGYTFDFIEGQCVTSPAAFHSHRIIATTTTRRVIFP